MNKFHDFVVSETKKINKQMGYMNVYFPYMQKNLELTFTKYKNGKVQFGYKFPHSVFLQLVGIANKILNGGEIYMVRTNNGKPRFCDNCNQFSIKGTENYIVTGRSIFCSFCWRNK